jgi:hypothetical protein
MLACRAPPDVLDALYPRSFTMCLVVGDTFVKGFRVECAAHLFSVSVAVQLCDVAIVLAIVRRIIACCKHQSPAAAIGAILTIWRSNKPGKNWPRLPRTFSFRVAAPATSDLTRAKRGVQVHLRNRAARYPALSAGKRQSSEGLDISQHIALDFIALECLAETTSLAST